MKGYTVRVYAIIIHDGAVLLSDECSGDVFFTKFPGGGHQWGEGIEDTLKRELKEELNAEVVEAEQFYVSDFFIPSKFDPEKQVVAVYYLTTLRDPQRVAVSDEPFDFDRESDKAESVRRVPLSDLTSRSVTFPADKKAVELLLARFGHDCD